MSLRRSISWSAAVRDMRIDRVQVTPEARRAHMAAQGFAKIAANRARTVPLTVSGRYDRSAIMRAAIAAAQDRRSVTGEPWGVCLSAALKGTWSVARAARLAVAH